MATIPLELPDDLREFVESTVKGGRFADVNEFIVALVDAAQKSVLILKLR